ncbi:MAG TPA: glycosyltransferase 87 family protein, partial [Candidatus Dormibacteraeota bacterium]|nr:glycosyltransferase 87 family protein [Candidatus Dormibacteraeota bacterium]
MLVTVGRVIHSVVTRGSSGLFNDFYDYWGAGVLLNRGQDPYDIGALHAVQRAAGLATETGTGYSYPVFFAQLMRPLALLSPNAAAFVFTGLSLLALLYAVALLLASIPELHWPVALLGGAAAGLFPPVIGSVYFGQANLFVLLLLAVAYRCVSPGPMLGLASAIKLYPLTGFMAVVLDRPPRWRRLYHGLAVLVILLSLQLTAPGAGLFGPAGSFLSPDTYWSNESINGWLSRLAIASPWTRPPDPGLPVEPLMLAAVLILTALTLLVLLRAPNYSWEGALALSLWLGTVAAPKNSLWNFTPLLLGVVFAWTRLRRRWWLFGVGMAGWL